MNPDLYLKSETSKRLYAEARKLPIVDYHCHLSPKEIWEDREFENIAQMWLGGDHYKWRLMRAYGIDEEYITGYGEDREKFAKYIECVSNAAGNPLAVWSAMELSLYFGIDLPLIPENTRMIWEKANEAIRAKGMSPRKLIRAANVERIVTTDDPADSLEYHRLLADDASFPVTVVPCFRPDTLLSIRKPGWRDYIGRLSEAAGVPIEDMAGLEQALKNRLDFFQTLGCRFSDLGIEDFPSRKACREEADEAFRLALTGKSLDDSRYYGFLWYLCCFLAGEYRARKITMQLHLAARRNANTELYRKLGADCGGDCAGDPIPQRQLNVLLDEINSSTGLPRTILYTLNPAMYLTMATTAGSFPGVTMGAAWWFNDHKAGIEEQLRICGQVAHLAGFTGMLTDSRSFLSYARHDYFRRIFCNLLGEWVESGELELSAARVLVRRVCYENSRALAE